MKGYLAIFKKVFWQDKVAFLLLLLGFIFNIIGWFVLYWQIKPNQTGVILHYNIFFGIDLFEGSYFQIFQASLGGLIIWLLNAILGIILYGQMMAEHEREAGLAQENRKKRSQEKEYFLDYLDAKKLSCYLLWLTGFILQLIVLVYVVSIILVNK